MPGAGWGGALTALRLPRRGDYIYVNGEDKGGGICVPNVSQ